MKPLLSYVLGISLALAGAFTCAAAPPATAACDSAYVTQVGNVITVLPTGISDTANLQCAFDLAVAASVSTDVRLVTGAYHTAQVVVNDFHGRWVGAGADQTVVMNLPNLYVTPVNNYYEPPSASNPHPVLFSFVDGDIVISNLAFRIVGDKPTQGWTIFDITPPIRSLAAAVIIEGTYTNAWIERVMITGEKSSDPLYGYNLYNGIYYEGLIGNPAPPLSGSYKVTNSTFRTMAAGTPVYNVTDASILISHNRYEDMFFGIDAASVTNSVYEVSHNKITNAVFGIDEWYPFESTKTLILNNTIQGVYGIMLEASFGEGNECLLLGNNVQMVTDIGIVLGASTKGFTVVGGSNKTNVLDLGTDNVLVGVNNMGTGVGPTIQHFMQLRK